MKKYAIIGFGGLGKVHFLNFLKLEKERKDIALAAICNADLEAITKSMELNITSVSMEGIDFSKYHLYTDYKEMIEKEELDFVIVTLPSFLHAEVCVYCMEQGLDVYTEKPMAITPEQCKLMLSTAERTGRRMMVGQCLRFTDEYIFLKEAIQNQNYGRVVKAEFFRKSPVPGWSAGNWLLDETKSGGCIVDLHVHDVDMMLWLFGKPESSCVKTSHQMTAFESVFSLYTYPDFFVSIISDWGIHGSFTFSYGYAVTFENAYVECKNGEVWVYAHEEKNKIDLPGEDAMMREIREFVGGVVDGKPFMTADLSSVAETMEQVFLEKYGKEANQ